jgi:hypothetical protein
LGLLLEGGGPKGANDETIGYAYPRYGSRRYGYGHRYSRYGYPRARGYARRQLRREAIRDW